jgi:hypothetical protein
LLVYQKLIANTNKEPNAAGTIDSKSYKSTHGVLPNSLVPSVPRSLFLEKNQKNILHTSLANDS